MKKLFFTFMALGLLSTLPSCKQCGYCNYGSQGNSDAVCKETGVLGAVVDSYAEAKANCDARGGAWVKTK